MYGLFVHLCVGVVDSIDIIYVADKERNQMLFKSDDRMSTVLRESVTVSKGFQNNGRAVIGVLSCL